MSTVEDEIRFIQSYSRLLKTRHDENLHFSIAVDSKYHSFLLPTLSLQLLVENAVKHNSMSRQEPITIDIFSDNEGYLVVENNLARKTKKAESTGIGLLTIREKYRLLQRNDLRIEPEKNNRFSVSLPLIRP
jgi:sensor histidine kinase YesM